MKALRLMVMMLALVCACSAMAQDDEPNELSIAAIRLGVTDLDASVDFYTKHLGCTVAGDHREHDYIMLENNGVYLVLTHAQSAISIGEDMCHSRINFEVGDLDASIAALKAGGVRFIGEKKSAVGRYATFLDPSGNQHNIKQLDQQEQSIDTPRIYDIGISVSDMKQATDFYVNKLGFEEQTRKYFPPVVPMKPRGSTFFILSEDSKHKAPYEYRKKAMTGLAFFTDDLGGTMMRLRGQGINFLHQQPEHAGNVIFAAFHDPFGNVHELMSFDDAPPQADAKAAAVVAEKTVANHSLHDLAWLAGTWETSIEGSTLREVWSVRTGEVGGVMGMFQWPRGGKSWMYEFMTLEQEHNRIVFRLRHFDAQLTPWEKDGPLVYPLASLDDQEAVFEQEVQQPDHPKRIIYRRDGDQLIVRLEPANSEDEAHEFKFKLTSGSHTSQ